MILAVAGAFVMAVTDRRRLSGITPIKLVLGSMVLVALLIVQFGLYRIFEKFALDPMEDARVPFAHNTIAAAKAYMPFGSGVGTFVSVYPGFEPAHDSISNVYANRAHNDLLEIWLEGGVTSILLLTVFLLWFSLRAKNIWWRIPGEMRAIDVLLMRAATIAIPLIIVHSLVDYPLRTGAMMAVFAFSCALLVKPVNRTEAALKLESRPERERTQTLVRRVLVSEEPTAAGEPDGTPEKSPQQAPGRWGEDIDWPEQWRNDRH
jgi:O-antigen ligase